MVTRFVTAFVVVEVYGQKREVLLVLGTGINARGSLTKSKHNKQLSTSTEEVMSSFLKSLELSYRDNNQL